MSIVRFNCNCGLSAVAGCHTPCLRYPGNPWMGRMKRQLVAGGTGGKLYLECKMLALLRGFSAFRRFELHLGRSLFYVETIQIGCLSVGYKDGRLAASSCGNLAGSIDR